MKALRIFIWFVVVIASTLTLVTLLSPAYYEIAGIKVEAKVWPNRNGGTELALPPFGEVRAKNHQIPLRLIVRVEGVNQTKLAEILNNGTTSKQYFDLIEKDAGIVARRFLLRLIILAAFGGILGSLLITRKWWKLLIASLIGMAITAMLVLGIYLQFNAEAFAQPQLSGPLGSAPWIGTAIEKRLNPLDTLREDVRLIARNLRNFVSRVEQWQPVVPEKGTIRVLVVSDIHNNPASFSLINRMVKDFRVDFVIDTGDITDFGTPIESSLLNQLETFDRPYIYTPGNHDTPAVVTAMKSLPKVTVLDGETAEIHELLIYGQADPLSKYIDIKPLSDSEMRKLARKFEQQIAAMSPKPLIVAVHDRRLAERIIGKAPIILYGHIHKPKVEEKGGTTIIAPGSTGATGMRLFETERPQKLNYTLSLLYVDPQEKRLVAVDSFELTGLEGEFVLKRKLIKSPQSD